MEISYSYQVQQALLYALETAEDLCNASVGTEHLLIGILRIKEARLSELLRNKGITDQKMMREIQILFGFSSQEHTKIAYTKTLHDILNDAERKAGKREDKEVTIDDLSLALIENEGNVALQLIKRSGIAVEELIHQLNQQDIFEGIQELSNLNEKVMFRKGKVLQREKELMSIMIVLMRMEKCNCVLTGHAGVGKSALVEELAYRIEKGKVPDELKGHVIAQLNINQLVAGTKYRGEFEKRIQKLIGALQEKRNIILFIDELHLIVGAGKAEGSLDVASVLKPMLARSDLKVIGATTDEEYEKWIAKDKALQRRFVRIEITEPDEAMTVDMLKEKAKDLSRYHQIRFQKDLFPQCVALSKRLMPHLHFPDKAIDLLDMSCSCAKCDQKQIVDKESLNKAASLISDRPSSFSSFCEKFNTLQVLDDKMLSSIQTLIDHHKNTLWTLYGSEKETMHMKKSFSNAGFQVHCWNAELLNELSFQEVLALIRKKLTAHRLQLLWIDAAQMLRADLHRMISSFFKQAVSLDGSCSADGVLVVLHHDNVEEKPGFVQNAEEKFFEAIIMDESCMSVLS